MATRSVDGVVGSAQVTKNGCDKMIYFDNAASTPLCDEAREVLLQDYFNPSSPHDLGLRAERALKAAAKDVAGMLSCKSEEVIFTSGGTESNNMGIIGAALALKSLRGRHRPLHIMADHQAHPSVAEPLLYLNSLDGFSVTFAAPAEWEVHLCEDTTLVCITQVSSETGDILDVPSISQMIKEKLPEAVIFVDGAQGFCKFEYNHQRKHLASADIYTFSGHKFHGPLGVGGLMVRSGIRLQPLMYGGGQQHRLRPGTENVSGILAMAAAAAASQKQASTSQAADIKGIMHTLSEAVADTYINQVSDSVSPYILNMSFDGVRGETLTSLLSSKGLHVSIGTACRTAKKESALEALGFSRERAQSAIRLSFSDMNTTDEAIRAKAIITDCVAQLRRIRYKK
ncbi:MAG: aminotransferase class V-fold PLP-dependent enzyme [Defluviitaleaceae bacterium]|nr:aminotransferase class V-fold PLP-dependent enzyme [Defluviitaleaceae bacterium]